MVAAPPAKRSWVQAQRFDPAFFRWSARSEGMAFDESAHPRGGHPNPGQFARRLRESPRVHLAADEPPSVPVRGFTVIHEGKVATADKLMAASLATEHARRDRTERIAMSNPGPVWKAFLVTKDGNPARYEFHVVTMNAETHIFSCRTGRLITILYPRPGQVSRYVDKGTPIPRELMDCARDNLANARNEV